MFITFDFTKLRIKFKGYCTIIKKIKIMYPLSQYSENE